MNPPIRQTVFSGLPVLNGIWYSDDSYVPYRLENERLLAGERMMTVPVQIYRRRGRPYYGNNRCFEPCEALDSRVQCGYLAPMHCAYLVVLPNSGGRIAWAASFSYWEQFEEIRTYGTRITVRTPDFRRLIFDAADAHSVRISLCAEPGLIRRL